MTERPKPPNEIWSQFLTYDSGEICCDAYDHKFDGGTKYVRADLPQPEEVRVGIPAKPGFFWGQWRIKAEGTEDENEAPGKEWEVMHVVENCADEKDPEYLMVMVPGVSKWQSLENFFWGKPVKRSPDTITMKKADVERCIKSITKAIKHGRMGYLLNDADFGEIEKALSILTAAIEGKS